MNVTLGDQVKDEVSGFSGIAIASHEYMQGCIRISVQPKVDKEGKLPEQQTFDEPQLVIIKSGAAPPHKAATAKLSGGPEKYMPRAKTIGD